MSGKGGGGALPWGVAEVQPGSVKTLALDKTKTFTQGLQKKSRFQKEKEEREARQKKQEEETAKIYEQFVASFDTEDESSKTFVRGDTYVPKGASGSGREEGRAGSVYKLSRKGGSEMDRMLEEMKAKQEVIKEERKKPSRQIDSFLEELKNKQVTGVKPFDEPIAPVQKGSYDEGDPETTNLYVGNLAPTITEEALQDLFKGYGEIYSVKIMWPRTEEERARKRNCGFVSFYRRADAEDAKRHMHDAEVEGYHMTIGWGKAIKRLTNLAPSTIVQDVIPPEGPKDLEPPPMVAAALKHAEEEKEAAAKKETTKKPEKPAGKWDQPPVVPEEKEMTDEDTKIEVVIPKDPDVEYLITRTARYVAKDGSSLEQLIRARETNNPEFAFLFNYDSPEGIYYRWKAYSMAMGDREETWRVKPFQINVGGPFWVPPPVPERPPSREEDDKRNRASSRRERERDSVRRDSNSNSRSSRDDDRRGNGSNNKEQYLTGRQLEKARDREKGRDVSRRMMSEEDAEEFQEMLRNLNESRQAIKEAMGFALDNAEASEDVVEVIKESLLVKETAIPIKVARLYLVSDVLHNSMAAVRNASTFRTFLEKCLPDVFEAFNEVLRAPGLGRITAQNFEEKVMGVLKVWESWGIYPPIYITGLEATFQRRASDLEGVSIPPDELTQLEERKIHVLREARTAGLSTQGNLEEVAKRLKCLDAYAKLKAAGLATSSVLAARGGPGGDEGSDSSDDDDIDGTPLLAIPSSSSSSRRRRSSGERASKRAKGAQGMWSTVDDNDDEDDDDDVDGVPLDAVLPTPPPQLPAPAPSAPAHPRSRYDDSDSDSDVDGRPLDSDHSKRRRHHDRTSSDSDTDDDGGMHVDMFDDASGGGGGGGEVAPKWTEAEEEERRGMLRRLETDLLLLRDDLEADHVQADVIEEKIQTKRSETVQAWEKEVLARKARKEAAREAAAASVLDKRKRSRDRDGRRSRSTSRSPRRSRR